MEQLTSLQTSCEAAKKQLTRLQGHVLRLETKIGDTANTANTFSHNVATLQTKKEDDDTVNTLSHNVAALKKNKPDLIGE